MARPLKEIGNPTQTMAFSITKSNLEYIKNLAFYASKQKQKRPNNSDIINKMINAFRKMND